MNTSSETSSYKMANKLSLFVMYVCRATQVYGWVCLKGLIAGPPVAALLQVINTTD